MYAISGKELQINGDVRAKFPFDIRKVIECGDRKVVLLTIPPTASMTENVFGVNADGAIVWQVEKIPETSIHPQLWYADMDPVSNNTVRLYNWNGWSVEVDISTGRVRQRTWSK